MITVSVTEVYGFSEVRLALYIDFNWLYAIFSV